jgi:hypothetical protein
LYCKVLHDYKMPHRPSQTSAFASSLYEPWYWHFREKRDMPCALPWHDLNLLGSAECRLVARSIQQFQLGEWARGRGLVRRASLHPVLSTDLWFLPSLELFIAEEQHHSQMLGRFLDRENIPRLGGHWIDSTFRRLRKLAGLELCAMVLVTAEVLAVPFYQALGDATGSPLLRSICVHILRDEAAHLHYVTQCCFAARHYFCGSSTVPSSAPRDGIFPGSGSERVAALLA